MFLHDHTDLQMSALYAVQVYCHNQGFPKGTTCYTNDFQKLFLKITLEMWNLNESFQHKYLI